MIIPSFQKYLKNQETNLDSTGRKFGRIGYKTGKEMATYIYDILKNTKYKPGVYLQ